MWYAPTITVDATAEPVSLVEAKRQVRVEDFTDDDAYLQDLIAAARSHVEGYCGARFAEQTVEIACDDFCDFAHIPVGPIVSIAEVAYTNTDGDATVLPNTVYALRGNGIVLKFGQSWPAKQARSTITVALVAGHESCPPAVKHAMRLWIADAYETRENAALPGWSAMDALLANHRYY